MALKRKKRRVLWLFAHLHKGGMQRAVSNISLALPDSFEQYVAYFGTENPGFSYNATMHDFNLPGTLNSGFVHKIVNAFSRLKALNNFVNEKNIDIVVSFGETANLYSLSSRHKAKKIITARVAKDPYGNMSNSYTRLSSMAEKLLYPKADCMVAVSQDLGKQVAKIMGSPGKVKIIPNLYHTEQIRNFAMEALPSQYGFLESDDFILNVGSLAYQKGQDDLIKIFANLSFQNKKVWLVLIGRGEWKEYLHDLSFRLGVHDRIVFIDFDRNPYRYMARAKVFVLSSRFEGFPNVLLEAMTCGIPVMAFDCPTGPSEILGDGKYGILINNRDLTKASETLESCIFDTKLFTDYSKRSLFRSCDYSSSKIISDWIDVLS